MKKNRISVKSIRKGIIVSCLLSIVVVSFFSCSDSETASTVDNKTWTYGADINDSVQPGDDFYEYALGSWLKANPLEAGEESNGLNQELSYLDEQRYSDMTNNPTDEFSKQLFATIDDTTANNNNSVNAVKEQLKLVEAVTDKSQAYGMIGTILKKGYGPFVNFPITVIDKKLYVSVVKGFTGIQYPNYEQLMTYLFVLFGYDSNTIDQKVENVVSIQNDIKEDPSSAKGLSSLDKSSYSIRYWDNPDHYVGMHKLTSVKTRTSQSDRNLLLTNAGVDPELVEITDDNLFSRIDNYSVDQIKDYLEGCIIQQNLSYLPKSVIRKCSKISGKDMDTQELDAKNFVHNSFKYYYNKLYTEKYLDATIMQECIDMAADFRSTMEECISSSDWMSNTTKTNALKKAERMHFFVGKPDVWEEDCTPTLDGNCLCSNMMKCFEFDYNFNLLKILGKDVTDTNIQNMYIEREEAFYVNNAFYTPSLNALCIFPGIMDKPVYIKGESDAYNYAILGATTIGHEMNHGFDNNGSKYNEYGEVKDWWTLDDKLSYAKKQQQMISLFNNYVIYDDNYTDGTKTLGENIADLGGIEVAYKAFVNKSIKEGYKDEELLNQKKKFFLAFAEAWKSNNSIKVLKSYLTNEHGCDKVRVNGTVVNMDAWYDLFNVNRDNTLYLSKENRTYIWK